MERVHSALREHLGVVPPAAEQTQPGYEGSSPLTRGLSKEHDIGPRQSPAQVIPCDPLLLDQPSNFDNIERHLTISTTAAMQYPRGLPQVYPPKLLTPFKGINLSRKVNSQRPFGTNECVVTGRYLPEHPSRERRVIGRNEC